MPLFDFSKPGGGLGERPFDWNPGDPTPVEILRAFWPGQPVNDLHFAATTGVRDSAWYADRGLVLEFRGDSPAQNWGIFVSKPQGNFWALRIAVAFDLFYVKKPEPAVNFIGGIGAVGTSADASTGYLGQTGDLNIGGTCTVSAEPYPDKLIRLNAPKSMFHDPLPPPGRPDQVPFDGDFWQDSLHHTTPIAVNPLGPPFINNSIYPIVLDVTAMPDPYGDQSTVNMQLTQLGGPAFSRVTQTITNAVSKAYGSDWSQMRYAGLTFNLDNSDGYNIGPRLIRITKFEVEWHQR